jgi:hypothetical protein
MLQHDWGYIAYSTFFDIRQKNLRAHHFYFNFPLELFVFNNLLLNHRLMVRMPLCPCAVEPLSRYSYENKTPPLRTFVFLLLSFVFADPPGL